MGYISLEKIERLSFSPIYVFNKKGLKLIKLYQRISMEFVELSRGSLN